MDRYLFFHIPKTAGKSLRLALANVFGGDQLSPAAASDPEALGAIPRDGYRIVSGHFSHEQLAHFPGRRVFTFLRDPVDVVLSRYFYFRTEPQLTLTPHVVLCRELSLQSLLERRAALRMFFNNAVRRLAGHEVDLLTDRQAVMLAQRHLQAFDVVGIHEEMDDSLDLLSYTFGWPTLAPLPRVNVTDGRITASELDEDTRARILDAARLDVELYQSARELFEQRKRAAWREIHQSRGARSGWSPESAFEPPAATLHDGREAPGVPVADVVSPPRKGAVRILGVTAHGRDSGRTVLISGERCAIEVSLVAIADTSDVSVTLRIFDSFKHLVYATRTNREHEHLHLRAGVSRRLVFEVPLTVAPGSYHVDVEVQSTGTHDLRRLDHLPEACLLAVSGFSGPPFAGTADLRAEIHVSEPEERRGEYAIGTEIDFRDSGNSDLHALGGWAEPEDWGRWTLGSESELFFRFTEDAARGLYLTATVRPFCPDGLLHVDVIGNGHPLARRCFSPSEAFSELEVAIPRHAVPHQRLHLALRVDKPRAPVDLGLSQDPRPLGLAFQRLVICAANLAGV